MKLDWSHDLSKYAIVYLDGRRLDKCLTADEETGWTERAEERLPRQEAWPVIRERGDVKIRFKADSPPWVAREYPDRIEAST